MEHDSELEMICTAIGIEAIRRDPEFPYRTGHLRDHATIEGTNGISIVFDDDIAPYISYLEYGTKKSRKHVGFIERALEDATFAIAEELGGRIEY